MLGLELVQTVCADAGHEVDPNRDPVSRQGALPDCRRGDVLDPVL
jgi:hypothetical protein